MYTALTIAGSDSCGGAGIQADMKTMCAHGVYAMSAVTALTAQNTTGVTNILEVPPDFLMDQLDAVFTDITPDAVKIGMLSGIPIMQTVALKLVEYGAKHVVLDPVMVATSGSRLMRTDAAEFMMEELFPLAEIITPNIPEAEALTGMEIHGLSEMLVAGSLLYTKIRERKNLLKKDLKEQGVEAEIYPADTAVLIKGGHSINDANDLLFVERGSVLIQGERIDNPNTHGTGCTLSSAIACNLAKGMDVEQAVRRAKDYLAGALRSGLDLGHGSGPVDHMWNQRV
ncbi:MAG: bifunctional hydroxymethylpyrimidine kinase/phosphomethylpyrimidine kinase [Lachnospiraceae bacterium]|nr:bifunctional hydroxymethylpyrimidine kinase/phosphomethylpyrimidine kinase [Lachnospiraceae bacterium]